MQCAGWLRIATAMQTRPTGLPSSSGSGPATPVIAALMGRRAGKARLPPLERATLGIDAPASRNTVAGTPKRAGSLLLGVGHKPPLEVLRGASASAGGPDSSGRRLQDSATTTRERPPCLAPVRRSVWRVLRVLHVTPLGRWPSRAAALVSLLHSVWPWRPGAAGPGARLAAALRCRRALAGRKTFTRLCRRSAIAKVSV